eukprot:tig00021070_g17823.t1
METSEGECERAAKRARAGETPPATADGDISAAEASASSVAMDLAIDGQASAAALSAVAAAMAAGGSPFDALPDELVVRIMEKASTQSYYEPATGAVPLPSGRLCFDQVLDQLTQLSHVSRRFRSLARQPSFWERIYVSIGPSGVSDEAIDALISRPEEQREALRSLCMKLGSLSTTSFIKLCKCFSTQLQQLSMVYQREVSPGVLAAVQHFSKLEQLHISCSEEWIQQNIQMLTGPLVQGPLQALASLPLQALSMGMPMTVETLQALAPLAPTLKRLECCFILDSLSSSPLPLFSAVAAFQQLERLSFETLHPEKGTKTHYLVSEEELYPLSSLSLLRVYDASALHKHTSFLSGMRKLEYVRLDVSEDCDISPLASIADGLLVATLHAPFGIDATKIPSFAATVSKLTGVMNLELSVHFNVLEALAQLSLKQWSNLWCLTLRHKNLRDPRDVAYAVRVPPAFLKRLVADVPSLEKLITYSPLPLDSAGGFVAVSALNNLKLLRHLEIRQTDAQEAAFDAASREVLQAALLNVEIEYSRVIYV